MAASELRNLDTLPPEFRLAVACCVWPAGDDRNQRIAGATRDDLNWPLFLKVVKRHRIQGLALDGIAAHAPRCVLDELGVSTAASVQGSLVLAAETFRITNLFEQHSLPVASLKGSSLSVLAFGNLALRHSRDIDLLVDPANALAADHLLHSAGYELTMPKSPHTDQRKRSWMQLRKHFEYRHAQSGIQLELHWRLFDNALFFAEHKLLASRVPVPIADDMTIPTLGRHDLLLYLCVHGSNHMWSRLKWIADFSALLSQKSSQDIPRLLEDAARSDCLRSVSQALLLSRLLFDLPSQPMEIPSDRATRRLLNTALRAMTQREGAVQLAQIPFGTSRIALARYGLKRDWRFWLREARLGFQDETDRHHSRIPPSLAFLLPLLRIPLWLTRRLFHGGRSSR